MIIDPALLDPANNYKLLIGSVVPRPIGWISTVSPEGVNNLAPFSFFNALSGDPPVLVFASSTRTPPKDTLANLRVSGEFVANIVSEHLAEQMNLTAGHYPPDVDEFAVAGLTAAPSEAISAPRVLESLVNMECKVLQIIDLSTQPWGGSLVLGEVVRFHVDEAIIDQQFRIDPDKLRAIGRMGATAYCRTTDRFNMTRP